MVVAGEKPLAPVDRLLLVVGAERPVPQHLEAGQVCGVADLVEGMRQTLEGVRAAAEGATPAS